MKNLNVFLNGMGYKTKKLTVGLLSLITLFGSMGVNTAFADGLSKEDLIIICNQRRELGEELCLLRERAFCQDLKCKEDPINENLYIKILNLEEEINLLTDKEDHYFLEKYI